MARNGKKASVKDLDMNLIKARKIARLKQELKLQLQSLNRPLPSRRHSVPNVPKVQRQRRNSAPDSLASGPVLPQADSPMSITSPMSTSYTTARGTPTEYRNAPPIIANVDGSSAGGAPSSAPTSRMDISAAGSLPELRQAFVNQVNVVEDGGFQIHAVPKTAQQERDEYIMDLVNAIKGQRAPRGRGATNRKLSGAYQKMLSDKHNSLNAQFNQGAYYYELANSRSINHDALHTQSHSVRFS